MSKSLLPLGVWPSNEREEFDLPPEWKTNALKRYEHPPPYRRLKVSPIPPGVEKLRFVRRRVGLFEPYHSRGGGVRHHLHYSFIFHTGTISFCVHEIWFHGGVDQIFYFLGRAKHANSYENGIPRRVRELKRG